MSKREAAIIEHPRAATIRAALAVASPTERQAVRSRMKHVIELLIAALDEIGGDPDLEDERDAEEEPTEPSLGWTSTFNQASKHRMGDHSCDDLEQDDADKEPNLGALERHPRSADPRGGDQTRWGASRTDDLEEQCEGGGDNEGEML
jgi:hypothetical protein